MISKADVDAAAARIGDRVRHTPVLPVADAGATVFKLEHLQHTGTFKARGAFNRILAAAESGELSGAGVVAASGGNAGIAVAHAAAQLGVPAEIYVPVISSPAKVRRLHELGAVVVQTGNEFAEAYDAAQKRVADTGATFCHPYDHPDMAAGAGTLVLEMWEQTGGFDTVMVAVGGGGLLAGVVAALDGRARAVAVEPTGARSLHDALAAGQPVDVPVSGIAADALGARRIGQIAFEMARRTGVRSLIVEDEDLIAARQHLWDRYRIVVEHSAAAALAALTSGAYTPAEGERVAVILCGANTDPSSLG
ncbi:MULTISPECIES: threonine/serine dehydratase [Catenuloplanes]|uniref:threonine ammonia-lyase n=1 Tax=Catenuloplanes niger TaxID=587534 RepID=A0AAE3ZXS1_9ACTN|nr:threonine/serine dehydratase [Catenuloplanes niger]MDR7326063.1 threonine dehydratase [Catenuloplanes niger]